MPPVVTALARDDPRESGSCDVDVIHILHQSMARPCKNVPGLLARAICPTFHALAHNANQHPSQCDELRLQSTLINNIRIESDAGQPLLLLQ